MKNNAQLQPGWLSHQAKKAADDIRQLPQYIQRILQTSLPPRDTPAEITTVRLGEYYESLKNRPEHLRAGQYAFHQAMKFFPSFAMEVRATEIDPFYLDIRLAAFFAELDRYCAIQEES